MNGLVTFWQPATKKKPIYRPQDQALRPASGPGDDMNMLRQKAMLSNMRSGFWSGVDAERPSGRLGHSVRVLRQSNDRLNILW
jgi:hypothetical protein